MKTIICSLFFLFVARINTHAQIKIAGSENVVVHTDNSNISFVKKELNYTRTSVQNIDTLTLSSQNNNSQIYVTQNGVFVVANNRTYANNATDGPNRIVIDMQQVKQASELINPTVVEPKEFLFRDALSNNSNSVEINIKRPENKKSLPAKLNNPKAVNSAAGNVLGFVYFDINSSTIKQEYYAELYKLNYLLEQMPDAKILLVGHSDYRATEFKNSQVAKTRALSVYHFLVGILKMDPERFDIVEEQENEYDIMGSKDFLTINPNQKNRSLTLILR